VPSGFSLVFATIVDAGRALPKLDAASGIVNMPRMQCGLQGRKAREERMKRRVWLAVVATAMLAIGGKASAAGIKAD
jgi:hypothetical protein